MMEKNIANQEMQGKVRLTQREREAILHELKETQKAMDQMEVKEAPKRYKLFDEIGRDYTNMGDLKY